METLKNIKKEVVWFSVVTLLVAYTLGMVGILKLGLEYFPVMVLSMPTPALICISLYLIWKKPIFKGNDLGFKLPPWNYWFLTPVSMFLLITSMYFITYIFNPDLILSSEIMYTNLSEASINKGGNPYLNLGLILLMNLFLAPILNFPIFLGEELGWRGYLTPRLLKMFTPAKAFILSGFIWGIWHLFGIILGHNYPGFPVTGIFMMILICIPMGIIFQYYYLKSGSIFIPMLAHGAVNWTASTAMSYFVNHDSFNPLLHGPSGLIGIVVFWVVGFIYYRSFKRLYQSKKNVHE